MVQMVCKRTSEGYNLRLQTDFSLLQVKSLNHDLKALQYFVPKIWNILPSGIANSRTHKEFSKKNLSHGFLEIVLLESVKKLHISSRFYKYS